MYLYQKNVFNISTKINFITNTLLATIFCKHYPQQKLYIHCYI